ncbi:MAG TPA: chemotaxis protein CheX [Bryobacteraceae bacterium]|jgi:chemotaxis protein CheY-P-specific phosphatase CheC|nr:chemotaxis protein CheX [Bryobacteraceae bacterium]
MTNTRFDSALRQSVLTALEEMFFVCDLEECDYNAHAPGTEVIMRVDFTGAPSGWLTLRAGLESIRTLAADFLGEDESSLGDPEAVEVFAELANIICGAVLTRAGSDRIFRLSSPQVVNSEGDSQADAAYAVALTTGPLAVRLQTETSEWSFDAKLAS